MYRIFFLVGIISLFIAPNAIAQYNDTSLGSDITISVVPNNPKPLEPIVLEVKSYSVDLNQSNIVWRYNGSIISSGVGKTSINTTAPASNAAGVITATVTGSGFTTTTASINLRTASVDLLWEAADSYTPPFYKGKALLSTNGLVRITAIPTRSAPKNLSFQWTQNDSVSSGSSGYNKDSFVFKNQTLQTQEHISLTASGGFFTGTNDLTLLPTKPQIILYQKQEGFVDYANGYVSSFATSDPGVVLRFEPYFFSIPNSINKDLAIDIKNNNNSLPSATWSNEVNLSRPDNGGQSTLDVSITTAIYSLQNALQHFNILFN